MISTAHVISPHPYKQMPYDVKDFTPVMKLAEGPYVLVVHPSALFGSTAGVKMNHVPHKGSNQAMNDLVGGQVKVGFVGV